MAIFVWKNSEGRPSAKRLSIILIIEALAVVCGGDVIGLMTENLVVSHAVCSIHVLTDYFLMALYLPFPAYSLDFKPLEVFKRKAVRYALLFFVLVGCISTFLFRQSHFVDTIGPDNPYFKIVVEPQRAWQMNWPILSVMFASSLAVSILTWKKSNSESGRERGKWFTIALGIKD